MVRSNDELQSKTGYIDASPHHPDRRNLLAPHGLRNTRSEHLSSEMAATTDMSDRPRLIERPNPPSAPRQTRMSPRITVGVEDDQSVQRAINLSVVSSDYRMRKPPNPFPVVRNPLPGVPNIRGAINPELCID
jgi:hypothetical protein